MATALDITQWDRPVNVDALDEAQRAAYENERARYEADWSKLVLLVDADPRGPEAIAFDDAGENAALTLLEAGQPYACAGYDWRYYYACFCDSYESLIATAA